MLESFFSIGPRGAPCSDGKPGLQGPPGKVTQIFFIKKISVSLFTQLIRAHFHCIGPPGPPGESQGYDTGALAALLAQTVSVNNNKGPSSLQGDSPVGRIFGNEKLTVDEHRKLLKKAYEQLKRSYDNLNKPTGEKSSPAKTCNELALARPELPSGDYWIDPNEGDRKDAILVHCDVAKRATCVRSQPLRSNNIQYVGDEKEIWLSEVHNGMKLTYKADSNQLTHLQMLSTHATQNITYHCKNSVGYYDEEKHHYRHAIKLLAWNDAELTAKNSQQLRYEVTEDGCKVTRKISSFFPFDFHI